MIPIKIKMKEIYGRISWKFNAFKGTNATTVCERVYVGRLGKYFRRRISLPAFVLFPSCFLNKAQMWLLGRRRWQSKASTPSLIVRRQPFYVFKNPTFSTPLFVSVSFRSATVSYVCILIIPLIYFPIFIYFQFNFWLCEMLFHLRM